MEKIMNSDFEVRLARLEKLGGDVTKVYNSDFEVSLAILEKLSGQPQNANDYNSVYEVDVEILKYEGGGSPTPPTPTEPVEDTIWFENGTTSATTVVFNGETIKAKNIKVSTDGENYADVTVLNNGFSVPSNTRLYLKYTPTIATDSTSNHPFSIGNITKIGGELKNAGIPYMYYYWFKDNTKLQDISELTIESDNIGYVSCAYMFNGCTVLKNTCQIKTKNVGREACSNMFNGCKLLTDCLIDDLNADISGYLCYTYMFNNCTSLTKAPKLSYTGQLSKQCYSYMFKGCTALTEAPELPSIKLDTLCYSYMFQNCTALTEAPTVLPAENVVESAYNSMFRGCTALTEAPQILAKKVAKSSMANMFNGCTSLVNAPSDLYAEYDEQSCYNGMFQNCTSLTKTPHIHLKWLKNSECCLNMFSGCGALNEIYIDALSIATGSQQITTMFNGVAEDGTVYLPKNVEKSIWPVGTNGLPSGWTIDQTTIDLFPENIINIKNEDTNVNHITLTGNTSFSTSSYVPSVFWYSTDGGSTWTEFLMRNRNSFDVALGVGEVLTIKGFYNHQVTTTTMFSYNCFRSTGKFSISGIYKNGARYILSSIFRDNHNLIDASDFIIDCNLEWYECSYMFNGCRSLVKPCQLPQTKVGYHSYESMFQYCSAMVEAPLLPAEIIDEGCYYNMFQNCTALTEAPLLPAKTMLNTCYRGMFYGCSNITKSVVEAEALSTGCFQQMFSGCNSLNELYCNSLLTIEGYANGWVNGVSSTGTFYYNPKTDWALTINRGNDTIPTNWDVQPWLTE